MLTIADNYYCLSRLSIIHVYAEFDIVVTIIVIFCCFLLIKVVSVCVSVYMCVRVFCIILNVVHDSDYLTVELIENR